MTERKFRPFRERHGTPNKENLEKKIPGKFDQTRAVLAAASVKMTEVNSPLHNDVLARKVNGFLLLTPPNVNPMKVLEQRLSESQFSALNAVKTNVEEEMQAKKLADAKVAKDVTTISWDEKRNRRRQRGKAAAVLGTVLGGIPIGVAYSTAGAEANPACAAELSPAETAQQLAANVQQNAADLANAARANADAAINRVNGNNGQKGQDGAPGQNGQDGTGNNGDNNNKDKNKDHDRDTSSTTSKSVPCESSTTSTTEECTTTTLVVTSTTSTLPPITIVTTPPPPPPSSSSTSSSTSTSTSTSSTSSTSTTSTTVPAAPPPSIPRMEIPPPPPPVIHTPPAVPVETRLAFTGPGEITKKAAKGAVIATLLGLGALALGRRRTPEQIIAAEVRKANRKDNRRTKAMEKELAASAARISRDLKIFV